MVRCSIAHCFRSEHTTHNTALVTENGYNACPESDDRIHETTETRTYKYKCGRVRAFCRRAYSVFLRGRRGTEKNSLFQTHRMNSNRKRLIDYPIIYYLTLPCPRDVPAIGRGVRLPAEGYSFRLRNTSPSARVARGTVRACVCARARAHFRNDFRSFARLVFSAAS